MTFWGDLVVTRGLGDIKLPKFIDTQKKLSL